MRFVFELESDLNVTKTQREVNLLNIKYDKRVKVEQLYTMAVTFVDFFSSFTSNKPVFSDWLCSQLIKFYRSNFEWLDKVECGLDGACGFVTRGAYVPGLGLVECPGEHSCQFDCFQRGLTFLWLLYNIKFAFYFFNYFTVFTSDVMHTWLTVNKDVWCLLSFHIKC